MSKGRIRLSESVRAAPETVFAFLIDLDHVPEWDPRVVKVTQMTRGPLRTGVILRSTLLVEGEPEHLDDEITDFDPPNRLGLRSVLGSTDAVSYSLSEGDLGDTLVDVTLTYDLPDAAAGANADEAGLRTAIANALAHSLGRLKELVERDDAPRA